MRKLIYLIFILNMTFASNAQVLNQLNKADNSMPSDQVAQVAFDGDGNAYIATTAGVYKYSTNGTGSTVLSGTYHSAISLSNGKVFVGGTQGKYAILENGTWTNYQISNYTGVITNYIENLNGHNVIGGAKGFRYASTSLEVIPGIDEGYATNNKSTQRGSALWIYDETDGGYFYFATNDTLVKYTWKWQTKDYYKLGGSIKNITFNHDSTKIIASVSSAIVKFDLATGNKTILKNLTTAIDYLVVDANDNVWYSYNNGGIRRIARFNPTDNSVSYDVDLVGSKGIVSSISLSPDNKIWMASATNGAFHYDYTNRPVVALKISAQDSLKTINLSTATYQWYYSPDNGSAKLSGANAKTTADDYTEIEGANEYYIFPENNGYYKVVITQPSGITESDPYKYGSVTTGISNEVAETQFAIYPNPNTGNFEVRSPFDVIEITLVNQMGQTETITNVSGNVHTQLKGMVVAIIKTNEGEVSKKLIIQ